MKFVFIGAGSLAVATMRLLIERNHEVVLVERDSRLGGNVGRVDLTAPYLDSARDILTEKVARVKASPKVKLLLDSQLTELEGYVGNFTAHIERLHGEAVEVAAGAVVVCTGYEEFDACRVAHLGYGVLPGGA